MNHKYHLLFMGTLVSIGLTACCCLKPGGVSICKENKDVGFATITCQPVDKDLVQSQSTTFKVEATGKSLIYQWYFKGENAAGNIVESPVPAAAGGQTAQITITQMNASKAGAYWCAIDSTGQWGVPARTRTREALLGLTVDPQPGGGQVQSFIGVQGTFYSGGLGTVCNGSACGYVNYRNGGVGYNPDSPLTGGHVKIHVDTQADMLNSQYHLMWFDTGGGSGCATNTTGSTTQKGFPIDHTKNYLFTVYFMPNFCPGGNAKVYMDLFFDP